MVPLLPALHLANLGQLTFKLLPPPPTIAKGDASHPQALILHLRSRISSEAWQDPPQLQLAMQHQLANDGLAEADTPTQLDACLLCFIALCKCQRQCF